MSARLEVNINDECKASLEAYARAHGITVTEAIRHAVSTLNYRDVQEQLGLRLAAVDADGKVVQIIGARRRDA